MARKLEVVITGDAKGLSRAFGQAGSAAGGFGRSMSKVGALALGAGVAVGTGLAVGIGKAISSAADFEQSLNVLQSVTKASGKEMAGVSKLAKNLGRDLSLPGTSAKDAAEAMTELAKGGLTVKQSMAAAKGVLQLSAAASIDNAKAATIAARALNTFGLAGNQAGRVADVLANASSAASGEITDMAAAFAQGGTSAKQAGLSIEDMATGISLMAKNGIVGSDAGTSLKTMLSRLAPQTSQAAGEMKKLGITYQDSHGKLLPLREQIGQYREALSKLTPVQQQQALQTIFGSDAIRAANIILGGGIKKWDEMREKMGQHGTAAALAAAKTKGFKGALEGFKSTFETLLISVGTPLLHFSTTVVQGLSRALGAFDGFIQKIAAAKTIKAKFKVVWDGARASAQDLAAQFTKFFIDGWTTQSARMGDAGGAGKPLATFHAGLLSRLQGLDWGAIGQRILDGIVNGMKDAGKIAARLAKIIIETIDKVPWDQVGIKLGPALVAGLASAFVTLFDPLFWAKNWELGLAVALTALSGPIGRFAGKLGAMFGPAIGRALGDLGVAIAGAVERLSPRLASALLTMFVRAGEGLAAAGGILARAVVQAMESALDAVRKIGGRLGGVLAFTIKVLGIQAAINAVTGWIGDVAGLMAQAGRAIGQAFATAFHAVVNFMKKIGLEAALAVLEPFSKLPSKAGDWATQAKKAIHNQLADMKFDEIGRNADRDLAKLPPIARKRAAAGGKAFSEALAAGTTPALSALKASAGTAAGAAGDEFGKHAGKAKAGGQIVGEGAAKGLGVGAAKMAAKAKTEAAKVGPIVGGFASAAFSGGFSTGTSAGQGVAAGIRSQIGAIAAAAAAASAASVVHMQKAIRAGSPSKETEEKVGIPLAQGLIEGFKKYLAAGGTEIAEATKKAIKMATEVGPAFQVAAQALGLGHAKAIVAGFLQGSPELGAQISQALRNAAKIAELVTQAAKVIGRKQAQAIVDGFKEKEPTIVEQARLALRQATQIAQLATEAAKVIGRKQAQAIVEGFKEKEPGIVEQHRIAFKQAEAIKGVIEENAKVLGRGHAQAIARGITEGSPGIVTQVRLAMAEAKKAMRDAAADAVRDARGVFETGFGNLASAALAAFDSQVAQWKSPAQKRLAEMQLEDQIKQLEVGIQSGATSIEKAQAELNAAFAGGDPATVKAAQDALLAAQESFNQAVRAKEEFNLGQLAAQQEAAHAKDMEQKRQQFANEFAQAQTWVNKHPKLVDEGQKKIRAVLTKYLGDFRLSGAAVGYAVAQGLEDSLDAVGKAARKVAAEIAKYLKTKSPAEKGELASLDIWLKGFVPTYLKGLDTKGLDKAFAGIGAPAFAGAGGGGRMPSGGMAMVGGGGVTNNYFSFPNYVGSKDELIDTVRRELYRVQKRNVSLGFQ
jgi:TP901 family phage tail tape measure protein